MRLHGRPWEPNRGALEALREADAELVAEDSERLGAALGRVLGALPETAAAPSWSATARRTKPPSSA